MDMSVFMISFVFLSWTITSFVCHFCAKLFFEKSVVVFPVFGGNVIILTVLQISTIAVSMFNENSNKKKLMDKGLILAMHTSATLATNWSIGISHTASTFAIKLMEPLTGALTQWLILGVRLSFLQFLSVPLVIYGALVFADDSQNGGLTLSMGSILAFMSNIFLALRNVFIKQNHLSKSSIFFSDKRFWYQVPAVCVTGMVPLYYLTRSKDTDASNDFIIGSYCTFSALFHAIYTYISTVIVLKHFSVVGHAFGNILKRLFVIGLLYISGSRSATVWNFVGLFICTVGVLVYASAKIEASWKSRFRSIVGSRYRGMASSKIIKSFLVLVFFCVSGWLLLSHYIEQNPTVQGQLCLRQGNNLYEKSKPKLYFKNSSLKGELNFNIAKYFATDLVEHPEEANKLSHLLTRREDVIDEAQRIHMNIFESVLKGYKYAMLFDYSPSENKGDSAIVVGEVTLLRKLNIEIVFGCSTGTCGSNLHIPKAISKKYTNDELVILFHGGGNIIGYHSEDNRRFEEVPLFKDFHIVLFPQSIFYRGDQAHIDKCKKVYASHHKMTFIWRDLTTFQLGKKLFPKVRSLLSPDIAYQIGQTPRFMNPTHDILWIKRDDAESPVYEAPQSEDGYRMHVADWLKWTTPNGTSPMEDSFLMTTNGMMFLQRGRVVITDRLHGHILCTLLDIPHVYIDNEQRKISNYHNTWTAGLENLILANSSSDALVQAKYLLKKLDTELPKIKGNYKNTEFTKR